MYYLVFLCISCYISEIWIICSRRLGALLTLDTTQEGKIVLTPKRKFVLANMIALCDLKAPPPSDLGLWDVAKPVGGEVL